MNRKKKSEKKEIDYIEDEIFVIGKESETSPEMKNPR